ncbi:MAG TPA: hypothetical protein VF761_06500 [Gemmatimonadaceae bacterium]
MSPDDFALALRALGTPLFLDDTGTPTLLGTEYAGTTDAGAEVRVTRLAPQLTNALRNPDAFVRVVERHGYLGAGVAGSSLFIVEPRLTGETLEARIAREGPVAPTRLAPIAIAATRQLAHSLSTSGAHGLITPATLRIDDAGRVLLRWSGIVPGLVAAGADASSVMQYLGAGDYLAPEVAAGGSFDARADIYAMGATLYAATTGRPPFGGRTTASTMAAVLTDESVSEASPARRLTGAVLRAIEHEPADRWSDPGQFVRAIEGSPAPSVVSRAPRQRRRAGTTVAIGAIGAILYLVWRLTR